MGRRETLGMKYKNPHCVSVDRTQVWLLVSHLRKNNTENVYIHLKVDKIPRLLAKKLK